MIIGTIILDFQTTNFESDSKIAQSLLDGYQKICEFENAYALDEPIQSAGWSFAKLYFAGAFAEKIYENHKVEIDSSKGKKFEEKFARWLDSQLKIRGCWAKLKVAPEMRSM